MARCVGRGVKGELTLHDLFRGLWTDFFLLYDQDEYESKQKELEAVANPIMQKVYSSMGGGAPGAMPTGGMPGGAPGAGPAGAGGDDVQIEEVD